MGRIESLEARRLLATFTITNIADGGNGSLRDVIARANANPGRDTINVISAIQQVQLTLGPIEITDDLSFAPDRRLIIARAQNDWHFAINYDNYDVSFTNVAIENANNSAIRTDRFGKLDLSLCFMSLNYSPSNGGAISMAGGELNLEGVRFTSNVAAELGGAIYSEADVDMFYGSVGGNRASSGGGIYSTGSLTADHTTFGRNTATSDGGALFATGPVYMDGPLFEENVAGRYGGAVYAFGSSGDQTFELNGATLIDNSAGNSGGALLIDRYDSLHLANTRVSNNQIDGAGGGTGGGIAVGDVTRVALEQVELAENAAPGGLGGGIFVSESRQINLVQTTVAGNAARYGGGLYVYADPLESQLTIAQSTISANTAETQAGGMRLAHSGDSAISVTLANSILSGNAIAATGADLPDLQADGTTLTGLGRNVLGNQFAGEPVASDAIVTDAPGLQPLDFYGGFSRIMAPRLPVNGLPASVAYNAADESLAVSPGVDNRLGTADDEPLLFDQRRMPRSVYGGIDIGAAEAVLVGDANFDGTVNLADFVILRNNFGRPSTSLFVTGDFDGDGYVNLNDFVLLRNHFGEELDD